MGKKKKFRKNKVIRGKKRKCYNTIYKEITMGKNLDMVITFKGKDYFGRTVHFHNKEMDCDEELVIFESA